jgi:CRP-like cAMP-binding protein
MPQTSALDALRASVLAKELSLQDCDQLAPLVRVHTLADGEVVCPAGQSDSKLHAVIKGALIVARKDELGNWQTLHTLTAGELAGELSFIDGHPHFAELRAAGETEIMSLDRTDLETLLERNPWLVYRVMRAIMRTVHGILRRMSIQTSELMNYIYKQHGRY